MKLRIHNQILGTGHRKFSMFDNLKHYLENSMNFSQALILLKAERVLQRSGWNGKGMWIKLQVPDSNSKMSLPYLYMKTADNKLVPWLASQTDILAEDWQLFE